MSPAKLFSPRRPWSNKFALLSNWNDPVGKLSKLIVLTTVSVSSSYLPGVDLAVDRIVI